MRVRFPRIAFVFACAVSLALPLAAQSPNGTVNGRVVDPSNRVITGADVLVINDATGVKYSGKTNDDGIYVVPNLPPGPYRLQVSKVGFKTLIKPDIVLNIQDALSINFTLPVGAVFETVTVEGGASMINTTDASVSTVVDQTYVKNMPLNGRSFQDLILLTPGVVTQTPQQTGALGQTGEFSVNGQRTESNYYTVDGVSANVGAAPGSSMVSINGGSGASGSVAVATALGTTQALVSLDALQEFRVQASSYSAEYGRNPGGQFAFETKSGTNQWHGTAFDYLRNGALDSHDWFNNYFSLNQPAIRQNDFGGTLGGPVEVPRLYSGRDKTFFFVSYEGLRLVAPQAAAASFVPDTALRAAAPSPLSQVLNAFPLPSPNGIHDSANGFAQYIGSWSNPSSLDSASVRFDHVVNDKLRLFFRFSNAASDSATRSFGSGSPSMNATFRSTVRTYTVGANSVFGSKGGNEFRLNYSSNEVKSDNAITPLGENTPLNLARLLGGGPGSYTLVLLLYGGYYEYLSQSDSFGAQRQWNLVDTVDLSLGRHLLKFGVDYRRLEPIAREVSPLISYGFLSKSQVLASSGGFLSVGAQGSAYPLYTNFSAFAQDEWKISQRLNLSLGLRWEVNPAPGVTQGLKPYTLQGTGPNDWTLAPQGTPLWRTTWYNVAPRLGVAYILHDAPGWETVVRAGGGVFFDTGQQLGSSGFDGGPGFYADNFCSSCPFPGNPLVPVIANPPVVPFNNYVTGFATHLQLPYTLQWNASIEQALGRSQALTISYVGSHAAKLLKEANFSSTPNASLYGAYFFSNGLTSDYSSLQFQFRRRVSQGLTALASYTWSDCMDYGSFNFFTGYQRGDCDFGVRHNFSTAFSFDLPSVAQSAFRKAVLHHWGLDGRFTARTAFPVPLTGNPTVDALGNVRSTGLDLVQGQPIYLYGANCTSVLQGLGDLAPGLGCPGGWAINPCAFVGVGSAPTAPCPTSGTVGGLAPRNFARGFGAWQMDLAVRRDFPIHENLRLQFRAEAFNIFNHPNFGRIDPNFGSRTFGQATGTLANSLGVLNPLYQMGGPRSMQFSLKVIF